jgi:hypothetical protein
MVIVASTSGIASTRGEPAARDHAVLLPHAREPQDMPITADSVVVPAPSTAGKHADALPPPIASATPATDGERCIPQPPIAEVALAEVLYEGYLDYFGHAPTANRLACAWAHCAFEHARGVKLFGNNLGHITTAGAWSGATCTQEFTRRVGTTPDRWESSSLTFRVHGTLHDGAVDYWRLLDVQYPGVLSHCDRGDAVEAARELRRRNYFTGPAEPYVQSVSRLYLEGLGSVLPKLEHPVWPLRGSRRPGRSAKRL